MPIYIVCGKCNCPRLARCELAAGRLMLHYPNIYVEFDMHEPEEYPSYLDRIKYKYKFKGEKAHIRGHASNSACTPFGVLLHVDEEWQSIDKDLVVYTREGQLIGDDTNFFEMLVSKYKLPQEEPDIPEEDLPGWVSELAKVNEEQFRKALLEKKNGPGILAEVKRRNAELLFAQVPPCVVESAAEVAAVNATGAFPPTAVPRADHVAASRFSTSVSEVTEQAATILPLEGWTSGVGFLGDCERMGRGSALPRQAVRAGVVTGSTARPSGMTDTGAQKQPVQHVEPVVENKEDGLLGLYAPQHVLVTRAIQNGLDFLIWRVAGLRQRNQANMALSKGYQYIADAFVLDSMLPRREASTKRSHHVVLSDEPITRQHFYLVPKKYLVTVTDHKVLDCIRTKKKICCFYKCSGIDSSFECTCEEAVSAGEKDAEMIAPAVARLAELLEVAIITNSPEKFRPYKARSICVNASELQSRDRLRFPLSAVSRSGYILDNIIASVPVCRAFADLVSAPDVCITLRSSDDKNGDEADKMKVLFDCKKITFAIREGDDVDQFAAAAAAEVMACFSTSQQSQKLNFYVREKFYRLHRRLVTDMFRGLLPDDWEVLKEILDSNNVLAAFQFLPDRWPDHRCPMDTHIHILPLPLGQDGEDHARGKVVNFLFERQIETALQQQSSYLRDLDFLHVLVPVISKEGTSSGVESHQRSRNEYETAFWKAHRILQANLYPQSNLDLTGFSLLVSRRFLLVVPHNAPQVEETFCSDVLTHAIWHKWPVPHPIAYLGGPIIVPVFKKQWTPHDGISPRSRPIVYAAAVDEDPDEIDFSEYGGRSHGVKDKFVQRVCVHEKAHERPLDILKLFCLKKTGNN